MENALAMGFLVLALIFFVTESRAERNEERLRQDRRDERMREFGHELPRRPPPWWGQFTARHRK